MPNVSSERARPVAAGEIGRLATLLAAIRQAQASDDPASLIDEAQAFRAALDRDAERLEPRNQQPLMLVLRKDVQE